MQIKRTSLFLILAVLLSVSIIIFFPQSENEEFHPPMNLGEETGTVTDIDGNVYQTVKIGNQWWMAENLKVSRYRNGDPIPNITGDAEWATLTTGAWSYYNNDTTYHDIYGKLYNWYTVNDPRGLCPDGWHVPTEDEWRALEEYLGRRVAAQGLMKSTRTDPEPHPRWDKPNEGATNESGFSGLPGGHRNANGNFFQPWDNRATIGWSGIWWSSTEYNNTYAYFRQLTRWISDAHSLLYNEKEYGKSIRCVKN